MIEKNQGTCTIDVEDSEGINIGNIHSDADKVLKLRKVKDLTVSDIYHFTKDKKEVDQIFNIIENMVQACNVDPKVEEKVLNLSQNVKASYLSKDASGLKSSYTQLTSFLSNHLTLANFIIPVLQNLN